MHWLLTQVTNLADQAVILPLAVATTLALAATGWVRGALAWAGAIAGTLLVILALKVAGEVIGWLTIGADCCNPSGHAASAAVAYGGLICLLAGRTAPRPRTVMLAAAAAGLLLGLTRVALRLHTLPEVLAGLAVGVAGAVAMIRLAAPRPAQPRSSAVALVALLVVLALHGTRLDGEPMVRRIGETLVEQFIR